MQCAEGTAMVCRMGQRVQLVSSASWVSISKTKLHTHGTNPAVFLAHHLLFYLSARFIARLAATIIITTGLNLRQCSILLSTTASALHCAQILCCVTCVMLVQCACGEASSVGLLGSSWIARVLCVRLRGVWRWWHVRGGAAAHCAWAFCERGCLCLTPRMLSICMLTDACGVSTVSWVVLMRGVHADCVAENWAGLVWCNDRWGLVRTSSPPVALSGSLPAHIRTHTRRGA